MEPAKTQASKLFIYSPIDFRDKVEEVRRNFRLFCKNEKIPSHILFFLAVRIAGISFSNALSRCLLKIN
jgi:hypothetical protein